MRYYALARECRVEIARCMEKELTKKEEVRSEGSEISSLKDSKMLNPGENMEQHISEQSESLTEQSEVGNDITSNSDVNQSEIVPEVSTQPESIIWNTRLRQLGIYVGAMLCGMHETNTAIQHLETLYDTSIRSRSDGDIEFAPTAAEALALVFLQIGDTISARQWLLKAPNSPPTTIARAVCSMADEDWEDAENTLNSELSSDQRGYSEQVNNLAIAKLYRGQPKESVHSLEELALQGFVQKTILFNLSTLYDLTEGVSTNSKKKLLQKIRSSGTESLDNYEVI